MSEVLERYRHVASLGAPTTAEEYIARLHANPRFYRQLVGRLPAQLPTVVDTDDVMQEAACAIMRAFQTHQAWRGPLENWVQLTVRNHIRDWMRRLQPRSRHHMALLGKLFRAMSDLEQRFSRHATDEELIRELGWTPSRYMDTLARVHSSHLLSLDDVVGSTPSAESTFDTVWTRACEDRVTRAMRTLPLEDRDLLTRYYVEDISLRSIAHETRKSETAIKKAHKRALARLRAAMDIAADVRGPSDSGMARAGARLQRAGLALLRGFVLSPFRLVAQFRLWLAASSRPSWVRSNSIS